MAPVDDNPAGRFTCRIRQEVNRRGINEEWFDALWERWVLVVCGDEMISKKLFQYVIK